MRIIPNDVKSYGSFHTDGTVTSWVKLTDTIEITDAEWRLILNGYLDEQHLIATGKDGYIVYNEDMKGFKHFSQYLKELIQLKRGA